MDRLKRDSYGKINLMLNISGVREDGYHTLETIMQTVGLRDTIEIRRTAKPGIRLTCDLPYVPSDERNIAWKAANKFIEHTGYDGGLDIRIEKTIPVGGGMAGGSTNAATVLNMLNEMCGYPIADPQLEAIALTLGADVPFCLYEKPALCEGIGEKITPRVTPASASSEKVSFKSHNSLIRCITAAALVLPPARPAATGIRLLR